MCNQINDVKRCAIEKGTLIVVTDGAKSCVWYHVLADTDIEVASGGQSRRRTEGDFIRHFLAGLSAASSPSEKKWT